MGPFQSFKSTLAARCCKKSAKSSDAESPPAPKTEPKVTGRAQWSSPTEFTLTCIGYSVGLGNVWRFPYLCYKSGGGAFLIPYMIMIGLIGMPMLFMEYSLGQYFGIGSLSIFKKVCPLVQGIGIGYIVLNALVCIYYNVIIALSLYYLFGSFQAVLPWSTCDNEWNTDHCGDPSTHAATGNASAVVITKLMNHTQGLMAGGPGYATNGADLNHTGMLPHEKFTSPSDEYFNLALMNMKDEHSIDNLGNIRWHLCLCLLLAWILVVMFVSRGIKSTGKVAYFTATFPYVMLTVLVVRGVTLPGASAGILYFVTPDWSKLLNPEIWFAAASQLFYSTNLAWGGMITMSSYSQFNHNCFRDAILINIVSFLTSLYAGFAVFSIIGYMAVTQGVDIKDVIQSGPELAFVVYPRALSLMPLAPMWTALFFFMLFLLGIGSQMVIMETVMSGLTDEIPFIARNPCLRFLATIAVAVVFFSVGLACTTQMVQVETIMTGFVDKSLTLEQNWRKRLTMVIGLCSIAFLLGIPCVTQMVGIETVMSGIMDEFPHLRKKRIFVLSGVAVVFFLIGLPLVTQGGMYVLQLLDWYSAGFCVLIIAIVECCSINWLYGNAKFSANIKEMLDHYPGVWWRMCWKYITPCLILCILVFSFINYEPAKYGKYSYPLWADGVGWLLTMSSVIPIFVVAIYMFAKADGDTIMEKLRRAARPVFTIEAKQVSTIDMMKSSELKEADTTMDELNDSDAQRRNLLTVREDDPNVTNETNASVL